MKTLTVTLPDGTTEARKSDRPYTHAIIVTITEERRATALAKIQKRIDEYEAIVAKNAPLVDLPEQVAAYEAAKARLAYLDEEVESTYQYTNQARHDKKSYTTKTARWLSRAYRNEVGTEDERKRGRIDSNGDFYGDTAFLHRNQADDALVATARGAIESAQLTLSSERGSYERQSERLRVGRVFVHGWSQSAKNAEKAAAAAREENPGATVSITTNITVHVPKSRAKAAAAR